MHTAQSWSMIPPSGQSDHCQMQAYGGIAQGIHALQFGSMGDPCMLNPPLVGVIPGLEARVTQLCPDPIALRDRKRVGVLGEQLAALYLETLGYELLDRNYRCKHGELDLVAQSQTDLLAIEVKTRCVAFAQSALDYHPVLQISRAKQEHLQNTLFHYMEHAGPIEHRSDQRTPQIDWIVIHFIRERVNRKDNATQLCDRPIDALLQSSGANYAYAQAMDAVSNRTERVWMTLEHFTDTSLTYS